VIVNDNQYLYSKWCFEIHRRTKEQKLKLKLQKNRLKFYYKDQILSILQLQELQIIKSQYRNAHSNSRKYRFRKTTLTRLLAKHFKWEPHEDVVDNPYLDDFTIKWNAGLFTNLFLEQSFPSSDANSRKW
jgi:hypothetical protein